MNARPVRAKHKPPQTIVVCVVQGKPQVILNDDLEGPRVWDSVEEAMEWTTRGHILVNAAERIFVLDCATGRMEDL